ncbi:crotonase/enoyl-CoA hydratase family protein [Ostreiculturibacter nitratireducens]|uniref:crotonase/enoyl-CoA hydratase family protein n=1 Tax=Ostreiculturibacter nitratireducens TaxID=3075226 RepID=UPI0031B5CF41
MTDKLLYEQEGHVVTLTLNMPELRNPVTDADVVDGIVDACARISADMSVRCVIITGVGKAFSSGGNLKHMAERSGLFAGDALEVRDGYKAGIQRVPKALWNLEVPVIAAVNGPAYGAGCDLTLMADIRIASTTATFAENFVRVGIIPGDGGAWLLPRQVGLSRAAEMTFTAEPINAETALAWGLVSRVVEPDALMDAARELAGRIARNPPRQLRLAKRLLREGMQQSLDSLLEISAAYQGACHQTEDHREAVASLLEKRDAVFTGR